MKSLLKVKAAPRVRLKQENGQQAPSAKRVKTEISAPAVKLEAAEEKKEENGGLAGLLGEYCDILFTLDLKIQNCKFRAASLPVRAEMYNLPSEGSIPFQSKSQSSNTKRI